MTDPTVKVCEGVDVSRETYDRLRQFEALIQKWSPVINLISKADLDQVWHRHIVDSAQIYVFCAPDSGVWADFGSGGGFPALVLAILSEASGRNTKFVLIESDTRKAVFLRTAIRELRLKNAEVVAKRVEMIEPLMADIVSARALTQLSDLLVMTERHLAPNGAAVFPKGEKAKQEVEAARHTWNFSVQEYPSQTSAGAQILVIKDLKRA